MSGGVDAPLIDPRKWPEWIIFEDEHILVLNKPGWLVCHPSKNGPWSSLVGAAKEYLGVESIHLASRLDRETSGVVLLAKHRGAASKWQKAIEKKDGKAGISDNFERRDGRTPSGFHFFGKRSKQ